MCVVHSPLYGGSADQQADRVIPTRYLATTSVPTFFVVKIDVLIRTTPFRFSACGIVCMVGLVDLRARHIANIRAKMGYFMRYRVL
jgi:hypothetical protein